MAFLPDIFKGPTRPATTPASRLGMQIAVSEEQVATHEVKVWAEEQKSKTNTASRGRLARHAMAEDMETWDEGVKAAAGDPVDLEIALGYLEDQHADNRREVRRP